MSKGSSAEGESRLAIEPFSAETERDAMSIINAYVTGWPYSRPVDSDLVAHWKTLGAIYQPANILVVYRDGAPRALLHGERDGKQHNIHLLAMFPGAVSEGVWLLKEVEKECRREGVERLSGPFHRSGLFYGGYVCGREPYHPHWATDATDAYVRAGFRISHPAVIMITDLGRTIESEKAPGGYEILEGGAEPEFKARVFRYLAQHEGKEVATSVARLYPDLKAPGGGTVGQIGFVGTIDAHRGKGLARILVKHCLERLKEWGASEALIATGFDNHPALKAYEKAGFQRRYNINEWSKKLF